MMRLAMLTCVFLGAAAASAAAQDQDIIFYRADAAQAPDPAPMPGMPFLLDKPIDVMMAEPFDVGEPVTGAPYSADIVTEVVQVLADGNRIERRTTSSVARDSQGRVRRTQQITAIGALLPPAGTEIVTINDPVAKVHYFLDAGRRVAIQAPQMFTKRLPPPLPPVPPGLGAPREGRTEPLGTRSFDGVTAEGSRSTVTIAAGAIGNQAPIDVVNERWYAPQLQTVVYSRRTDPRFGETTFRLENVVRAEPSPDLFQVPPDYTVQTGPPAGPGVRIERRIER